ncbi:unnamed protein product [Lathyrus sativus]|nr:unnamed protein product [Lathyrus sativus]
MSSTENNNKSSSRITWEGCSVLLDINDGDRLVFARLSPAAKLKIGKKNCSLQSLIGCPFGTVFQLDTSSDGPFLSPFQPEGDVNNADEIKDGHFQDESKDDQLNSELKDNRSLIDNNTAQSLTGEDIEDMRRQGAKGNEIVDALIANSASFDKKTSFSQEKYRRKKQKKYAPRVLIKRPVARSICEAYFKKNPLKIGFLRVDTLSLLLSMANVSSNSDILVVDMVGGILTGAVAERLGGTGFVCNSYLGQTPHSMDIVRIFNLSDEICNRKKVINQNYLSLLFSSFMTKERSFMAYDITHHHRIKEWDNTNDHHRNFTSHSLLYNHFKTPRQITMDIFFSSTARGQLVSNEPSCSQLLWTKMSISFFYQAASKTTCTTEKTAITNIPTTFQNGTCKITREEIHYAGS